VTSQPAAAPPAKSSDALAQDRTDLALERTRFAAERTLMAWIRTAVSMISFGFSLYKFFEYLREAEMGGRAVRVHGPRDLGLTLIGLGTLTLLLASWQHHQLMRRLGGTGKGWALAPVVALLVAAVGILAFLGVLLRTGPF
jgi:putative membrane protein